MTKKIIRHIIQDKPSSEDLFHGGGHERTAHSLSRAIVKFDEGDSAIGLDGSWGSGKSSVVEMAARKLSEKNGKRKKSYHFFTFDIWKSQGSGFRRSYLEHFITWAKKTFPKKHPELTAIESQIQGKTREIQTNNQPILDWYGIIVLVFLPFLPIYYFWAKKVFDDLSKGGNSRDFLISLPFLMLLIFVVGTLLLALYNFKFGKDKKRINNFKAAISQLLLISSRQHQNHKVVQKVREIDPNDYEFHATLREILGVVQSDKDRVVVVLDNIDRLPRKEIKEYWALVRSIFSRTHGDAHPTKNTDITAIVPYDRKLIESSVSEDEGDLKIMQEPRGLSSLASRELFSKTFDEVLVVAPPVLSNAREFFADKLEEALPKQVSPDERFRTYRIFCELLAVEGGTTTPRQIVTFVNDLSSLYELHDGKFSLPTVAAYIAHQDLLTESPAVLNTEDGLNQKIVNLTADEKLIQNLAAMVFNVEEDLAFQILLDDEIAKAIIADEAELLVELSSAPGFDLRIDDVVQANIDEWNSTREFGTAITNIASLLKSYKGDAKTHIANSVLNGFKSMDSISLKGEEYKPYLSVFEFATEQSISSTVTHFVSIVFDSIHKEKSEDFHDGRNLVKFLQETREALTPLNAVEALRAALSSETLPNSLEYMFGLNASIARAGFDLSAFGSTEMDIPEDSDYFENQFVKFPILAIPALVQFKTNKLLTDDKWLSIANACLSALKEEGVKPENVGRLLEIVAMTWCELEEKRRTEIELEDALIEGEFFRNVGEGKTEVSKAAQANLLFLVQEKLGETISIPTKLDANNTRSEDTSDAFETFQTILEGGAGLEQTQAITIAQKVIAARCADHWLIYGKVNREHEAVSQIVLQMFSGDTLPFLGLGLLLTHFAYLEELLDDEELSDVLRRYAGNLTDAEIKSLSIDELPSGFLHATHAVGNGYWDALHNQVDQLLNSVDQDAWPEHIEKVDHTVVTLIEKLSSSGCELDGGQFRTTFINVIKDVLSGHSKIEAGKGALDTLLSAIDPSYHENIWRTLREEISNVTAGSLADGMKLFPELIANVIQLGSRITKPEKDNLVRHLLIPALEGRNSQALRIFVGLGYTKLKGFQNTVETSTEKMLVGAWKSFKDKESDRSLIREVSEALHGKRKTKSIFDPTYWISTRK